MDEFPEFERRVIDALRQPLEDRVVTVSRAKGVGIFPADFILIAALNPCACGNLGSSRACICTPSSIAKYQKKISGPIIDRIDLWIEVPLIDFEKMSEKKSTKKESVEYRNKVIKARTRAKERMQKIGSHVPYNSAISAKDIETLIPLDNKTQDTLNRAAESLQLSPRQYHKIIKLARTIADLDEAEYVLENHLLEALQYRKKESF